jgi:hypothetical protein
MVKLDKNIPFVKAVLNGAYYEAAEILAAAEKRHRLRWSPAGDRQDESSSDKWYHAHLWPFLTETHFVVAGEDLLSAYALRSEEGKDLSPTWRHWGYLLADWANKHWVERPGPAQPWQHNDFYSGTDLKYLIADYDIWLRKVTDVLSSRPAPSDYDYTWITR